MTFPTSIRPVVGQALITRVTRLYNGTMTDCLHELLQNARRAGATRVDINLVAHGTGPTLVLSDDGRGIDDPVHLLTLGQSGWDQETANREDPAGMGLFSLAGRHVTVRSWSRAASQGWQVVIPVDGWTGDQALSIEPCGLPSGTEISVLLPADWVRGLDAALKAAALYCPLPVRFQGDEIERKGFLDGACYMETGEGYHIGVFKRRAHEPRYHPRVNFHGVTLACQHDDVVEVAPPAYVWSARIDIDAAPSLQLVLPARKEMVENEALKAARVAMERAIYRAIAAQGNHRLPFKSWLRAKALGVDLPEAARSLIVWKPTTADSSSPFLGAEEATDAADMIIIRPAQADIDQAAASVLSNADLLGGTAADPERQFEGYDWYDRLPRLTQIDFTFWRDGQCWTYGTSDPDDLPGDLESGPVDSLLMDLVMAASGHAGAVSAIRTFEVNALIAANDGSWLEEANVLFSKTAALSPEALGHLIDASFFCASEDSGSDSWQTQYDRFCDEARDLANTLLLGEEKALLASLHSAFHDHLRWLIPEGRQLTLTARRDDLVISLSPLA
jgi:hypothetical protein